MQQTVIGARILKSVSSNLELSEANKKFVTDIVAKEHLKRRKKTSADQLSVYADLIVDLFPNETKVSKLY